MKEKQKKAEVDPFAAAIAADQKRVNRQFQKKKFDERRNLLHSRKDEILLKGKAALERAKARDPKTYYKDVNVVMFSQLYQLCTEMEEALEMIDSVNIAMDYLTEVMGYIDDIMQSWDLSLDEQTAHSYGLFSRWRTRRKIRKARRNQKGRMKVLTMRIKAMFESVGMMTSGLSSAVSDLTYTVNKPVKMKKEKVRKNEATGPSPAVVSFESALALEEGAIAPAAKKEDGGANLGAAPSSSDIDNI